MTLTQKIEIPVAFIDFNVGVNYDEDDMPMDYPGRADDRWCGRINLEDGRITTMQDEPMPDIDLYMKVANDGEYTIISADMRRLVKCEDYVPGFFPEHHFGDYLIFTIKDSVIQNWEKPSGDEINEYFGEED